MPPDSGVKIVVRVRPMLARELAFDNAVEVLSNQEILVYKPDQEFASVCDRVLGVQSTQDDVYQQVKDCVLAALSGYNNTVIAYGQTGTGKTHTMMGEHGTDVAEADAETQRLSFGIIPRAVQDLFAHAKTVSKREGCVVNVTVSYLEVYNDRMYDLLQPYKQGAGAGARDPMDVNRRKAMLEVREDPEGNTFVQDLLRVKVKSQRNVLQLISRGNRNRAARHTEMNIHSSRSHAILQLGLEQWPDAGRSGRVLRSKLNFVDLAGSERWNTRLDMGAERISELTAINSSLSALASVVVALSEGRPHVPYRSSKLTHLLQDSLGGNCRTTIISTVSPSVDAFEETVSTLKFSDRAVNIGNNPIVNVSRDMNSMLALKEKEIQRLRAVLSKLTAAGSLGGGGAGGTDALVAEALAELGGPGGGGGGGSWAEMQEELQATRLALDSERALRAELEVRLQHAGLSGLPSSAPVGSSGSILDPASPRRNTSSLGCFRSSGSTPPGSSSSRFRAGGGGRGRGACRGRCVRQREPAEGAGVGRRCGRRRRRAAAAPAAAAAAAERQHQPPQRQPAQPLAALDGGSGEGKQPGSCHPGHPAADRAAVGAGGEVGVGEARGR